MNLSRLGRLALALGLALATPACGLAAGNHSATGDDDLTKINASDVKLESSFSWGDTRTGLVSSDDKKYWAVSFDGAKGNHVQASVWSSIKGTAYVLKKVGTSYAQVRQTAFGGHDDAKLDVTLTTDGQFFIAFVASFPKTGSKIESVRVSLGGKPTSSDAAWLKALKEQYEQDSSTSQDGEGTRIDESKLPAAAKRLWNEWNKEYGDDYAPSASLWEFQGKKVYVVEDDNDGGMMIAFFDEQGNELASGSAGESTEFTWD